LDDRGFNQFYFVRIGLERELARISANSRERLLACCGEFFSGGTNLGFFNEAELEPSLATHPTAAGRHRYGRDPKTEVLEKRKSL